MPQYKFQYLIEATKGGKVWVKLYIWDHDVETAQRGADSRMKRCRVFDIREPEEV